MNAAYYDNLLKNYRPYTGYQPPVKTKSTYEVEIKSLEREIEIAKGKMNKTNK